MKTKLQTIDISENKREDVIHSNNRIGENSYFW